MRYNTIPFFYTIPATTEYYMVSSFIPAPFKISRVMVRFRNGSQDNMLIRIYEAEDPNIPENGEPSGTNLFASLISDGHFTGDNVTYDLLNEVRIEEGRRCIKVYANNTAGIADQLCVLVTVVKK